MQKLISIMDAFWDYKKGEVLMTFIEGLKF